MQGRLDLQVKTRGLLEFLAQLLHGVAAVVVGLMVIHVVSDVLGRAVLGMPSPATTEFVAYYYMVLLVFLPLAELERTDRNIVVDIFYISMNRRLKRIVLIVGFLCGIFFFGMLTWQSWKDAMVAYTRGEMVDGYYTVIIWPARFGMIVAFGLATITLCVRLFDEALRGKQAATDSALQAKPHNSSEAI